MAKQFPPKISSILMTPDPHYIPGYGGYCPQYKYSVGQSYGKLTSKLLTDPGIARSGRLILQPSHLPPPSGDEETDHLLRSYKVSWADQKLNDVMIPGYTGFIPKMEHYFSKTYTKTCKDAIREFEKEQLKIATKKQELELISVLQSGKRSPRTEQEKKLLTVRCSVPLRPTARNIPPYNSPYSFKPLGSPYLMANENPHKRFVSGYKGFVPRAQFLFGAGYPIITNKALIEFSQVLNRSKPSPVPAGNSLKAGDEDLPKIKSACPPDRDVRPRHSGYTPGTKFQFGHNYKDHKHNLLTTRTIQKQTAT